MSMRLGISCATPRDGIIGDYCASAEIRNCVEDGTQALLDMFDFCMANNIYAIVNLDLWTSNGHLTYTEQTWRQRVDGLVYELLKIEPTAAKWRITIDNEPMKYMTKEKYSWLVNIAYDQIKIKRGWKHVMIGAGNEEFSLAAKMKMFEYILENCQFDYLDIHIQAAVIEVSTMRVNESVLNYWGNIAKGWAVKYRKKLSCTEANWCDVSKESGYQDLIKMLNKAEEIGCEDFCIVFLDYIGNYYNWLSFNVKGVARSNYWQDMLNVIKSKKPIMVEDEDMKLDILYKQGSRGIGVKFIQKVVNAYMYGNLLIDGIWGLKTEEGVRAFQEAKGLTVDGKVGIETFPSMIEAYPNIWNQIEYAWAIGVR